MAPPLNLYAFYHHHCCATLRLSGANSQTSGYARMLPQKSIDAGFVAHCSQVLERDTVFVVNPGKFRHEDANAVRRRARADHEKLRFLQE